MKKLLLLFLLYPVSISSEPEKVYLGFTLLNTTTVYTAAANFNFYVDGSTTPIHAIWADCHDISPNVDCMVPFPPLSPGLHSMTLTQELGPNESQHSEEFSINLEVLTPFNLKILGH
jgi:hypothetical protein